MEELARLLQAHFGAAYTVERELGGGGMSRVFLAEDHRLGRRVVVKVLLSNLAATLSVERFQREIMLVAGLTHPHIVPMLDAGDVADLPFFVMPYVEGESLRARIQRGPLSVRETVSVLKDVSRALSFAHGRGIVHRDIKPDNVLLAASAAVVTDFGVAKALDLSRVQRGGGPPGTPARDSARRAKPSTITAVGTSLGTPAYMAPEQAAADPSADHRADLYSLGIVAYEMLVGAPPFHGRSPQALLAAQMSEAPPPLSTRRYDVPVALSDLVMHCLEKDPSLRPRSASDVLRALENPDVVSGAFAVPPATVRRRRSRWLRGTFAAAVAVVLPVVLMRSLSRGEPAAPPPLITTLPASAIDRSLAVLPLASAGGDAREQGIAAGMTSELTNAVARMAGFRVASQTAASAARTRDQLPGEIGRVLNVGMFLEGTVQRAGERIRVTVRLVNARTDSTLWAERFEGAANDIFAVQDSLARSVVSAIVLRTGAAAPR